ncbi:MAG: alpha-glucosidase C-terminal domain-containing protein, partial [Planctomycetes bacterium]|nr:alpha-glucosidase C-terminal domain-containing protein [Planctomycetota bacterium]
GLRLDAVPYLFEREGTNCENLPETHDFLKALRAHVDRKFKNRMLLAEANQWPEDAAAYFGEGDECHMAYHFPVMPRLFMALRQEDNFPVVDIMEQTPKIPDACQWALFLRNHDELTLEMVTDEERDYMYKVYAQNMQMRINLGIRRRLAPLLGNDRKKIELLNGILLSLPGTPILYYGDEIGMGDNIYLGDRNGVRTPMHWDGGKNAGFSEANPQQLYLPINIDPEYHYEFVNVEAQLRNSCSLLWWMKRLNAIRNRYKVFGRGSVEFLQTDNRKILTYLRQYEEETVLVVANLSRFSQCVALDLAAFAGCVPIEMFDETEFIPVGDAPYMLSLGPHSFYWFRLVPNQDPESRTDIPAEIGPELEIGEVEKTESLFSGRPGRRLERLLFDYIHNHSWLNGRTLKSGTSRIVDLFPIVRKPLKAHIVVLAVERTDQDPAVFTIPLVHKKESDADRSLQDHPHRVIARYMLHDTPYLLHDGLADPDFCKALLNMIERGGRLKGRAGEIAGLREGTPRIRNQHKEEIPDPIIGKTEACNPSIVYGNRLVLRFFRHFENGLIPGLEVGRFLTKKAFAHTPPVKGSLEYLLQDEDPTPWAIVQGYVPNQGDAWSYTLDRINHTLEQMLAFPKKKRLPSLPFKSYVDLAERTPSQSESDLLGTYFETASLLGKRIAEFHLALMDHQGDPAFKPEPITRLYQRALYQSMRNHTRKAFRSLRLAVRTPPPGIVIDSKRISRLESLALDKSSLLLHKKIRALRIRCHGDLHLGQILYTGGDFVITDFEGEPERAVNDRGNKFSPLRDVAGMLRSFEYAGQAALLKQTQRGMVPQEHRAWLESWVFNWQYWTGSRFLRAYLDSTPSAGFLPDDREDLRLLLNLYLVNRALHELSYDLENRPDWAVIPFQGIQNLLSD